jgi:hypothetical protein
LILSFTTPLKAKETFTEFQQNEVNLKRKEGLREIKTEGVALFPLNFFKTRREI